jgi:hypothetical protein
MSHKLTKSELGVAVYSVASCLEHCVQRCIDSSRFRKYFWLFGKQLFLLHFIAECDILVYIFDVAIFRRCSSLVFLYHMYMKTSYNMYSYNGA